MSDLVIRDLITWIVYVLSVYRLAHMIAMEDGPFDMFSEFRGLLINAKNSLRDSFTYSSYFPSRSEINRININRFVHSQLEWVYRGFNCVLCVSFWLALPAIFIHWTMIDPVLAWLSIAGACLIIHKKLY